MSQDSTHDALVDDGPVHDPEEQDRLNFRPYVNALYEFIASPEANTPMTIGIYGKWGSGKTSLMRMIETKLNALDFPIVWFDAWKYDREEALWRALILRVLEKVRGEIDGRKKKVIAKLDKIEESLYHKIDREQPGEIQFDWSKLAQGAGKAVMRIGLNLIPVVGSTVTQLMNANKAPTDSELKTIFESIQSEKYKTSRERMSTLEEFQEAFGALVHEATGGDKKLIIFVDDLDRCEPGRAIEVLEAIKLFLDVKGCFFLLGIDDAVISRGIEIKYKELGGRAPKTEEEEAEFKVEGRRYLEKIIQVPFEMPPIERTEMKAFVTGMIPDSLPKACGEVFALGAQESPRQIKRTINTFLVLWKLAQKRAEHLQPLLLAKLVAIRQVLPALYRRLRESPWLLQDLEKHFTSPSPGRGLAEGEAGQPEMEEVPSALRRYINHPLLKEIMSVMDPAHQTTFLQVERDEIRRYFSITRSVKVSDEAESSDSKASVFEYEPQTVLVEEGPFWMGATEEEQQEIGVDLPDERPRHEVHLATYRIGRYPVTNAEYRAFVNDASYEPPQDWREGEPHEDRVDHPVTDVSWEDAHAYCAWLSGKTGRRYRLPTEAQWEKAAAGPDGRPYPWDGAFDREKLNSEEGGVGETTPVGAYSEKGGDSVYGCSDMVGNVWEWCSSLHKPYPYEDQDGREEQDEKGTRVLRGGSFFNNLDYCRCAARYTLLPFYHSGDVGFRVVVLPSD